MPACHLFTSLQETETHQQGLSPSSLGAMGAVPLWVAAEAFGCSVKQCEPLTPGAMDMGGR